MDRDALTRGAWSLAGWCLLAFSAAAETVAWWRFEDGAAGTRVPHATAGGTFDPALSDSSGHGHWFSAWSATSSNQAMRFSADAPGSPVLPAGISNATSVGNEGPLPNLFTDLADTLNRWQPTQFTLEVFFAADDLSGHRTMVGRDGTGVVSNDSPLAPLYFKASDAGDARPSFNYADRDGVFHIVKSDTAVTTARWYHIAAVSDGSLLRLYLDGLDGWGPRLVGSTNLGAGHVAMASGVETNDRWSVTRGMWSGNHVDRFAGRIDEVRLSDAALAPADFLRIPAPPDVFRPPAVPLLVHDPYFSIWSFHDRLHGDWPRHWTGSIHGMSSLARVDGTSYRLMGAPAGTTPMPQESVTVRPTRTVYTFTTATVRITMTFLTPALPHDLDTLSRPVTYLVWDVVALDGGAHAVELYFDLSGEFAVNTSAEPAVWYRDPMPGLAALRIGAHDQRVLGRSGDNLRIEWGWGYAAAETDQVAGHAVVNADEARALFLDGSPLPATDATGMPRQVDDQWPVLAFALNPVAAKASPARRWLMIAYDDLWSIQYRGTNLPPYWRRHGAAATDLLQAAAADFAALEAAGAAFDAALWDDLVAAGGERYARLVCLAYRQSVGAHKLVAGPNGEPWFFSKENFSNGCIDTTDVTFPSCPLFLALNPALLRGMLAPALEYARSAAWPHPYAPHDLGTYPLANGQVYNLSSTNDGDRMPVEESANMLIMVCALAEAEGHAAFAARYADLLAEWAAYLEAQGFDPANQLCSDDFMGPLAHSVNLSAKAILGLGAWARLCERLGNGAEAARVRQVAEGMVTNWMTQAAAGGHYRLAFDQPGTWSQKYNLIWDRALALNLFPASVFTNEGAWYLTKLKTYGLALDSRETSANKPWCLLDWLPWTASLSGNRADFTAIMDTAYRYASQTSSRIPLSDWWDVTTGVSKGFRARSVVGSVFMPFLLDRPTWDRWSARALQHAYRLWAAEQGLAPGEQGAGEDPDGDGAVNLREFALGSAPLNATSRPPWACAIALSPTGGLPGLYYAVPAREGAVFSGVSSKAASVDGVVYRIDGFSDLPPLAPLPVDGPLASALIPPSLLPVPPAGYDYATFRLLSAGLPAEMGFLLLTLQQPRAVTNEPP